MERHFWNSLSLYRTCSAFNSANEQFVKFSLVFNAQSENDSLKCIPDKFGYLYQDIKSITLHAQTSPLFHAYELDKKELNLWSNFIMFCHSNCQGPFLCKKQNRRPYSVFEKSLMALVFGQLLGWAFNGDANAAIYWLKTNAKALKSLQNVVKPNLMA